MAEQRKKTCLAQHGYFWDSLDLWDLSWEMRNHSVKQFPYQYNGAWLPQQGIFTRLEAFLVSTTVCMYVWCWQGGLLAFSRQRPGMPFFTPQCLGDMTWRQATLNAAGTRTAFEFSAVQGWLIGSHDNYQAMILDSTAHWFSAILFSLLLIPSPVHREMRTPSPGRCTGEGVT